MKWLFLTAASREKKAIAWLDRCKNKTDNFESNE